MSASSSLSICSPSVCAGQPGCCVATGLGFVGEPSLAKHLRMTFCKADKKGRPEMRNSAISFVSFCPSSRLPSFSNRRSNLSASQSCSSTAPVLNSPCVEMATGGCEDAIADQRSAAVQQCPQGEHICQAS